MNKHRFSPGQRGPPVLRIQGAVYHNIGSVESDNTLTGRLSFLQMLFYDPTCTNPTIQSHRPQHEPLFAAIQQEIVAHNVLFQTFMNNVRNFTHRLLIPEQIPLFSIRFNTTGIDAHPGTVNRPTAAFEVAGIVIQGSNPDSNQHREVVVHQRSGRPQRISICNAAYDPLAYSITHVHGTNGWYIGIPRHKKNSDGSFSIHGSKHVTVKEYYSFYAHIREKWSRGPDRNCIAPAQPVMMDTLLLGGKLAQQYWIDQSVKMETNNLNFLRHNQPQIRAELYRGLHDAISRNDEANAGAPVERTILPSTFIGGGRHQHQCYQDAMAMVRKYGKPDFFITFTCNPKWPEITRNMKRDEQPHNRPDITCRVFHMKLQALLEDLQYGHVMGTHVAHTCVVEFQKRGLPHAHILLIVASEAKPKTPEDYDCCCSAEIPNPHLNPTLHSIVLKQMRHGPCGELNRSCPCMQNGTCSKGFPKATQQSTSDGLDSYPTYRRRCLFSYTTPEGVQIDDTWIAPYNSYFLQKYNCHVNVEICSCISAVKYLYKYVYKGADRCVVSVVPENNLANATNPGIVAPEADEITLYQSARYMGSCEAFWRIYGYILQDRHPPIQRLQLHLPDEELVYFVVGNGEAAIADRKMTMLQAFFKQVSR
jgi:hypothetical protein